MEEVKVNKNPQNFIEQFEREKTEFDKYQEAGVFNVASMTELLMKTNDKRKWYFLHAMTQETNGERYKIEFRYNTGNFRLILFSHFDVDLRYYWHKLDWMASQLGMQKGTTYDKLKYTEFYLDYDDYTILSLKDLFYQPKDSKERKIYREKKKVLVDSIFPWDKTIKKDAKKLVNKLLILEDKILKEIGA